MSQGHGLLLVIYVIFAAVLLLAGFVYKEIRDYRDNNKNPKLPFHDTLPVHKDVEKKDEHVHDGVVAASR